MSETAMEVSLVCSDCHKLFDTNTGEVIADWKFAKWIETSKETCRACWDKRDE